MKMGLEQRFASIVNKGDLLRPITPDTDPEEAIARLQEYNRRDLTATSIARRRDHLRQVGVADLDTWTFFSNPALSETQEDSLQFLRDHWPLGIESLLVHKKGNRVGSWGSAGCARLRRQRCKGKIQIRREPP